MFATYYFHSACAHLIVSFNSWTNEGKTSFTFIGHDFTHRKELAHRKNVKVSISDKP